MNAFISMARTLRQAHRQHKLIRELGDCPEQLARALDRTQDDIPVLIVSYNNGVYTQHMVQQLHVRGITPIVIDNQSTDLQTQALLRSYETSGGAQVVRCRRNLGHMVGFLEPIYAVLPEVFAYSDPDLQFHPKLPDDFLTTLADLTTTCAVYKAGLALDLVAGEPMIESQRLLYRHKPFTFERSYSIREWESQFWRLRMAHETLELYAAPIDTTLAVYRKQNFRGEFVDAVRVAGSFSAVHLPWFPDRDIMSSTQRVAYLGNNISTSWVKASSQDNT